MRAAPLLLLLAGCVLLDDPPEPVDTPPKHVDPAPERVNPAPEPVDTASRHLEILGVLINQEEAWNRGDLEKFLDGYWRSDQTVFAGGDKVLRGFEAMAARYRKTYDTREKMGKLSFSNLKFESIEADRAVVTGSWELKRATDNPGGVFTLILRKRPEGWRIVHDHTSSR